jgi:hypothetical protein
LVLLVSFVAACGTTSAVPSTPNPSAAPDPSMPITVDASCGVREVSALGAVWVASPPYATAVLPPGTSSPFVAAPAGMTSADPRLVEQVPARFTLLAPNRARIDSPRLTGAVVLARLPTGAMASVCRP